MKLALPMLSLIPGEMGGSETAVRGLVVELCRREDIEVSGFVGAQGAGWLAGTGAVEHVLGQVRGGPSPGARLRGMLQAAVLPTVAAAVLEGADVVHYPFTVPVPKIAAKPTVVTLYDVQHLDLPHLFSRAELRLRSLTYDRAARRADAVMTISEFSRRRIVSHLGISPERVHVAPLGVSRAFSPDPDPEAKREDFVFYPARAWPHKNHQRLIEAMSLVRSARPGCRLVLTGGGDRIPHTPDWITQLGNVSSEELLSLYRRAGCLAFPSFYEGFGMPPIEAMASGCPVVVSTAGALPEVCADAALLCDPTEVESIADAILRALTDSAIRVRTGLVRAKTFTWGSYADAHVRLYRSFCA